MAKVSTCLIFIRKTEEAFQFYKAAFKTEFEGPIMRFSDVTASAEMPPMPEADKNLIMHIALPILGGHVIRGNDCPEHLSQKFVLGTNIDINLEPDTRAETDRLFNALSKGGTVEMPMQDMFWGAYFGCLVDKFGIQWRFNCASKD
jgi:PhnB protein